MPIQTSTSPDSRIPIQMKHWICKEFHFIAITVQPSTFFENSCNSFPKIFKNIQLKISRQILGGKSPIFLQFPLVPLFLPVIKKSPQKHDSVFSGSSCKKNSFKRTFMVKKAHKVLLLLFLEIASVLDVVPLRFTVLFSG